MPSITSCRLLCVFVVLSLARAVAAPLTSASVTELKNDVRLQDRPAKVADTLAGADVLRTGERSLAEIEFNDKTITRLGSKSVFSFAGDAREFHVEQGLSLICVPKGTGGGRIVTAAITAAIEGTTVVAEHFMVAGKKRGDPPRPAGKYIFIEGNGVISTADGKQHKKIHGGQMIIHVLGDPTLAEPQDIDLATLLDGSGIFSGFRRPLPTTDAINGTVTKQRSDINRGALEPSRFFLAGRGSQLGQQEPQQPGGIPAVNDPTPKDSGGIISLSEQAPCNCGQ